MVWSLIPGNMSLVKSKILLEHLGNRQIVGAAVHAFAALGTVPDRLHHLASETCRLRRRHSAGNYRGSHCRRDHHPMFTGLAVFASAAELLTECRPVFLHGREVFRKHPVFSLVDGRNLIDLLDRDSLRRPEEAVSWRQF